MSALTLTRRTAMAGAATLAAAPFAAASSADATPIARLWRKAQQLDGALAAHRADIEAAEALRSNAAPGWMYLSGEGHALGDERYQTLVATLQQTPRSAGDVAIMARVAQDRDMLNGPRAWAAERVASAAMALA